MADRAAPSPPAQAAVLAGGLATRMYPCTERVPKFLLPVAGRPFGAWLLERLRDGGIGDVVLCVGHLGGAIRDAIGDGTAFGVRVRYSDEGEARLGTAGALRRAIDLLEPAFVVTYGDSYLGFRYVALLEDLAAHPEALGTMAVWKNEDRLDASNAAVERELVVRYEKRKMGEARPAGIDFVDYGATAIRREVVEALPAGAAVGFDAVQRELAARGRLRAFVVEERFYEIGSEAGLAELEGRLSGRG